jgi:hypothetical protein
MNKPKKQRRRLLVDPRSQLPFLFGLSVLAVINTLLVLFALAWVFAFGLDERIALHLNSGVLYKVLGLLALTTILAGVWALASTRHSVGLLHRVTALLRETLHGERRDPEGMRLRGTDKRFRELEACLLEVAGRLGERGRPPEELFPCLHKLEKDLLRDDVSREEVAGTVRELREKLARGESA